MAKTARPEAIRLQDAPLNYRHDQENNLNPQLRRLNMKLGLYATLDLIPDLPAALLLASAAGALARRKYLVASLLVTAFAVRQALGSAPAPRAPRLTPAQKREIEFERRAIKAQRGDYGNLEVIPFR